jgi:hypothetical protein
MKGRTVRGFQIAFVCTALAAACASEEKNDFNSPVKGSGGSAGKNGNGGSAGSSAGNGFGGTNTGGKGGTSGGGAAGKGGTSGSNGGSSNGGTSNGGSSGGGGSGGTGVAGDCSALEGEGGATSEIAASLHVEVKMDGADEHDKNQPKATFNVVNGSDATVSLLDLKVRYFFVSEFDCGTTVDYEPVVTDFRLQDPHVAGQTSDVGVEVVAVAANGAGCDAYIEFTFFAPESLAAGQHAAFSIYSKPPNEDYETETDQSNDASYGACSSAVVPWEAVPLYQDDLLVWGDEPYTGGEGGEGGMGGSTGEGGAPSGGQTG